LYTVFRHRTFGCIYMLICRLLAVCLALPVLVWEASAQQQPATPPPTIPNPSAGGNLLTFLSAKTPYEFWLTCVIALLGLIIIAALIFSVRKAHQYRPEDITRPVIVVTVIIGTLILVTAGYNNEQIAPAFGLFGTIVGYMLGRLGQAQAPAAQDNPPAKDP